MHRFDALDDVIERIDSNKHEQNIYFSTLVTRVKEEDPNHESNDADNFNNQRGYAGIDGDDAGDRGQDGTEQDFLSSVGAGVGGLAMGAVGGVTNIGGRMGGAALGAIVDLEAQHTPVHKDEDLKVIETGLGSLTADEYVKLRLLPTLAYFTVRSPPLSKSVSSVGVTIIALSVVSSALSPFGQSVWIPAILALSGAISSWTSHKQSDLKLIQTNIALHQLHQLLIWWDSLTMIEKRSISNKEKLVTTTEQVIQTQAVSVASSNNATRSSDDDEDDD